MSLAGGGASVDFREASGLRRDLVPLCLGLDPPLVCMQILEPSSRPVQLQRRDDLQRKQQTRRDSTQECLGALEGGSAVHSRGFFRSPRRLSRLPLIASPKSLARRRAYWTNE